jgi:hypothetical protein
MTLDRNKTRWTTLGGKEALVKDLEDDHVLNIVGHLKKRVNFCVENELFERLRREAELYRFFIEEAEHRHLGMMVMLKRLQLMPWECKFEPK